MQILKYVISITVSGSSSVVFLLYNSRLLQWSHLVLMCDMFYDQLINIDRGDTPPQHQLITKLMLLMCLSILLALSSRIYIPLVTEQDSDISGGFFSVSPFVSSSLVVGCRSIET